MTRNDTTGGALNRQDALSRDRPLLVSPLLNCLGSDADSACKRGLALDYFDGSENCRLADRFHDVPDERNMENMIRHYLTEGKALPYRGSHVPNKAMLTGEDLGKALGDAIEKKKVTKKAVAEHFGVKPPSVQDWVKFGRIGKQHLNELVRYFSDVVPPSHWGMDDLVVQHEDGAFTVAQVKNALGISPDVKVSESDVQPSLAARSQKLADQIVGATRTGLLDERGLALLERNLRQYVGAARNENNIRGKGSNLGELPGEVENERRSAGRKRSS